MMASEKFVTFTVSGKVYGIPILAVREINRQLDATRVPQAPPYVHGLINLRGQIVTMLDLKVRLGLSEPTAKGGGSFTPAYTPEAGEQAAVVAAPPEMHNIILKSAPGVAGGAAQGAAGDGNHEAGDWVGILVDAIGDIITAETDVVERLPANMGEQDTRFLHKVVKMDNVLVGILDVDKVLSMDVQPAMAAA